MFSERDYYRNQNRRNQGQPGMSAVATLILVNVVCFILSAGNLERYVGSLGLSGRHPLELWRLFTYQFLHENFGHIFWNMYGLWLFGRMVEQVLGKTRFYILYFFSGVLGGLFFLLANWGARSWCIGASGAEFGVMVATAVAFPRAEFFLLFPPVRLRLWVMALIYCGLEILFQVSGQQGGVAHLAHLGGALGGFLFMRRLIQQARRGYSRSATPRWARPSSPEPPPEPEAPPEPPYNPDEPFVFNQNELNRILDKMSRQGYEQLTTQEKQTLRRAAEELKRRR